MSDETKAPAAAVPSFLVEVTDVREHEAGGGRFQLNPAATKKIVGATEDMLGL